MNQTPAEISYALRACASRLSTARAHLADGKTVEIADLEDTVDTICTAIAELPEADRKGLEKPLAALLDELDKLTRDLRAQYDALKKELKALSDSGRAVQAYGPGLSPERK